ncbi:MAG: NgoFVII family restriction endonuclease [Campylobacteraceae bacterium]|nr:NgoFVII family restriction endonuclease [Campylobacteraceae bacterium]
MRPCRDGANRLKIISGYATSAMAFHHLEKLRRNNLDVKISLLIGMCSVDGLSVSNHKGFQNIVSSEEYKNKFSCSYIYKTPSVHSKLYIWFKNETLYKSFIGSANYTQNAFYHQREVLAEITDKNILDYYRIIETDSIYCNELETEDLVRIYNDKNYYKKHVHEDTEDMNINFIPKDANIENAVISLLDKDGKVPRRGGLNWGQREGRNKNQAYIQLPPDIYKSDFFPPKPQHFTVITDDSKSFICTRAQKDKNGQCIHTPHNNSLLGEYFRNRLGLSNGAFVWRSDLDRYGRTDIVFYKIDNENYYMDFSVQ